jgi:uncharacterized protein (DUF427 family)
MVDNRAKQPGPSHPITIEANPARVVVMVAGEIVASSERALTLREAEYPPVQYIPLADVEESLLAPSDHVSYCPFKGDATYFSVPSGGERSRNAVWVYRAPYPAVVEIKDHVAFYPDRVDAISEQDPATSNCRSAT